MSKLFIYAFNCVCAPDVDKLHEMIDSAKSISYNTFIRNCQDVLDLARALGYERSSRQGLTLKKDCHIGYHKSTYDGYKCFFLTWSAIEYVFLPREWFMDREIKLSAEEQVWDIPQRVTYKESVPDFITCPHCFEVNRIGKPTQIKITGTCEKCKKKYKAEIVSALYKATTS